MSFEMNACQVESRKVMLNGSVIVKVWIGLVFDLISNNGNGLSIEIYWITINSLVWK